jgi:hypothetical protein
LVPWFARAPSRTRLLALQLDTWRIRQESILSVPRCLQWCGEVGHVCLKYEF